MKKLRPILIYFLAAQLLVFGIDKFYPFIPEACSLAENAPQSLWYGIGVLELIMALLLFFGKAVKPILIAVALLMVWAIVSHIRTDTYDIGGAIFLALLALAPLFLKKAEAV